MNVKPSRPRESDDAIFEQAIDLLMPSVWDWVTASSGQANYPNEEREGVRAELKKCIGHNSYTKDGYQLARSLEYSMWEPDSELVDILDSYTIFIDRAHREAVKLWVVDNQIIPQKNIGDAVLVKVRGVEYDGFILSVDTTTAQYTINIPALGHIEHTFDNGVATRVGSETGTFGTIKPVEEIDD
jgi:hypothetical protein